jgi:predicted GIY-YIG superfamily endonuclease
MWYVYFLRLANDEVYVWSTNDLRRRREAHDAGQVQSTKGLFPSKLISYVAVADELTARRLERCFKPGSGTAFAEKRFWAQLSPA